MSVNKHLLILMFLTATLSLFGQEGELGVPSDALSDRLYFSDQEEEYFGDELGLPQRPINIEKPVVSEASKVRVETIYLEEGAWRVVICFPKKVEYCQEAYPNALYLEFNQAVETPDLIDAIEKLGYLFRRFNNGLHSIYLESKRDLHFYTDACDNMFFLDIFPEPCFLLEADHDLKLARARLLVEWRCYQAAFEAIDAFLREYPDDKDGLILLGILETTIPRWIRGVEVFYALRETYPEDADIQALLHDAIYPHTSFVKLERQLQRQIDLSVYQYWRLSAEWMIQCDPCSVTYIGGIFQRARGHITGVFDSVGNINGFLGTRYQGSVYARRELASGDAYAGNLYFGEGVVFGGGIEATWIVPCLQGFFTVEAFYHKPYWDIFETLSGFGREDGVKASVSSVESRFLEYRLLVGFHRVGIQDVPNGFTSLLVGGEIFYFLNAGNPQFALTYGLAAEYVYDETLKDNLTGGQFRPVPLESYEIHSFTLHGFYEWRDYWQVEGFAGPAFNRIGTNDYTYGFFIRYRKPCCCGWEVEGSIVSFPSTTVDGARAQYVTGSIKFHF